MTRKDSAPKTLGTRTKDRLLLVAQHLLPCDGPLSYDWEDVAIQETAAQFAAGSPINKLGLVFALWFVQWLAPLFLLHKMSTFGSLAHAWQNQCLTKMQHSASYLIRAEFMIINSVLQIAYYSDERVLRKIGYDNFEPGTNRLESQLQREDQDHG